MHECVNVMSHLGCKEFSIMKLNLFIHYSFFAQRWLSELKVFQLTKYWFSLTKKISFNILLIISNFKYDFAVPLHFIACFSALENLLLLTTKFWWERDILSYPWVRERYFSMKVRVDIWPFWKMFYKPWNDLTIWQVKKSTNLKKFVLCSIEAAIISFHYIT